MKLRILAASIAVIGLNGSAFAQTSDSPPARVEITGSSIKRIASEGALPVEVITRAQIDKAGIVTAEQLISRLSINGTGADNLASNGDVVSGTARGNNGASSANLRGQGADSTLVLLNGRRVATHGMKGQAVDINSIPMAAVERVEVLKDGASAIYGTDAIGGVINFILRKNYTGLEASAFTDITQHPGGEISKISIVGGLGDLDKDKYNILMTVAHSENKRLMGNQRDFVDTFQPDRGLSVDTRGTPIATAFAASQGRNLLGAQPKAPSTTFTSTLNGTGPIQPGTTLPMAGINILNLPGAAGCNSVDGMEAYDASLWGFPDRKWGCAWDTGRAAVLQQPVKNTNYVLRGTFKINEHQIFGEVVGSHVEVEKTFSPNQISPGSTFNQATWYPLNANTKSTYDAVYNAIVAVFPTIASNYGQPIAYRWRCMPCDYRQIQTQTDAGRVLVGADGPIGTWDYRVGLSQASSESESKLGTGFHYTDKLRAALGSGLVNPFSLTQTQAGIDALNAASAYGQVMYGGKQTVTELDASVSGEIYKIGGGAVMAAFGVDKRKEEYSFNGSTNAATLLTTDGLQGIFNAPFDASNSLTPQSRTISAIYAEVLVPLTKQLELNVAARRDSYSGFGSTTNPKVSFRYTPAEQILFRGSYNTGFRVPAFNQLFNAPTITPNPGTGIFDPATCPSLKADGSAGCVQVHPDSINGGKADLAPETAKQKSLGVVWAPVREFSANVDYWEIEKEDTIRSFGVATLSQNYALFTDRFIRDSTGTLLQIDQRWVNSGGSLTRGIELGAKVNGKLAGASWEAGIDGSYLIEKKSRPLPTVAYGANEVGKWVDFTSDLSLRWKHTAYFTYARGDWSATLEHLYRSGYKDQVLPGVANGTVVPPNWKSDVDAYQLFNISATYTGFKNLTLTAGIKNLLDKDPPFAVAYDSNSGAGSTWEPRVADPRGRSYTLMLNYKFF